MLTKAQELINLLANSIYDREKSLTTEIFFTSKETSIVENFLADFEREIKKPVPEDGLSELHNKHNKDDVNETYYDPNISCGVF